MLGANRPCIRSTAFRHCAEAGGDRVAKSANEKANLTEPHSYRLSTTLEF